MDKNKYLIDEIAYLTSEYIRSTIEKGYRFASIPNEEIRRYFIDWKVQYEAIQSRLEEKNLIDLPYRFIIMEDETTVPQDFIVANEPDFIHLVDTILDREDRPSLYIKTRLSKYNYRKLMNTILRVLYELCGSSILFKHIIYEDNSDKVTEVKDDVKMETKNYELDLNKAMYVAVKIMKHHTENKKGYTTVSNKTVDEWYKILNQKYYSDIAELSAKSLDNSVNIGFTGDLKKFREFNMTGLEFKLMVNTKFCAVDITVDQKERKRMKDILKNAFGPQRNLMEQIEEGLNNLTNDITYYTIEDIKANTKKSNTTKVKVRWFDGYIEEFDSVEARSGGEVLWIKLANGEDRWIPLTNVRWFSGLK